MFWARCCRTRLWMLMFSSRFTSLGGLGAATSPLVVDCGVGGGDGGRAEEEEDEVTGGANSGSGSGGSTSCQEANQSSRARHVERRMPGWWGGLRSRRWLVDATLLGGANIIMSVTAVNTLTHYLPFWTIPSSEPRPVRLPHGRAPCRTPFSSPCPSSDGGTGSSSW